MELRHEGADGVGLRDFDPQERAICAVQRGLPQLLRVHFAKTLVALDAEPLAACREHGVEKLGRPADRDRLALGIALRRLLVSFDTFDRLGRLFIGD